MRHATGRLGGLLLVISGVVGAVAFAWSLRIVGPSESVAEQRDGSDAEQNQELTPSPAAPPLTQPRQPITGDEWLAAQPLANDPPAALPAAFWRAGDAEPTRPTEQAPRLEIVGERGRQNVEMHDANGNVHELTGFTQAQHVYDAAISADGTLAYVWHMAFTPRQVSTYDVATRELLHRFKPGSGGRLRWAASDPVLLLQTGGMGMGGSRVTVFAPDGTRLVQTGIGSQALSPDDGWVLSTSWQRGAGRVEVFQVATGKRVFGALLPVSMTATMIEPQWDADHGPMLSVVTDPEYHSADVFELAQLVSILERDAEP
jgi:hypothetical protein